MLNETKLIQKANFQLLRDHGGCLIASFPRSGSTVVREVFSTLFNRTLPDEKPRLESWKVVMNINKPFERQADDEILPLLARTHRATHIAVVKTLFLFRLPGDALLSYYTFLHRGKEPTDLEDFLSNSIPRWKEMAEAALAKHQHGGRDLHVMSFESYKADPAEAFKCSAAFVGLPGTEDTVQAVQRVNDRFHATQRSKPTALQPQRGVVGAGRSFFNACQIERIDTELMPLYDRLRTLESTKVR